MVPELEIPFTVDAAPVEERVLMVLRLWFPVTAPVEIPITVPPVELRVLIMLLVVV